MRSPESYSPPPVEVESPEARERRLLNLGNWDAILCGDDAAALAELREFAMGRGMDEGRFEATIAMRRLRRDLVNGRLAEMGQRLEERPRPDDEEINMGAYREQVEPHVVDTVIALRNKGYETRGSGFDFFDDQKIYLDEPQLADLPEETLARLAALGAGITPDGKDIFFTATKDDDEASLKAKWEAIEAVLPNLGQPAADSKYPYGAKFKKNAEAAGKVYDPEA